MIALAACNQRESPRDEPKPAPAPAPAPPVKEVIAPPDAAPIAIASPPDAAVVPDAAKKRDKDEQARLQDEAARYAAALVAESDDSSTGDLSDRMHPGTDLNQQIQDLQKSGANVKVGDGTGRTGGEPRIGNSGGPADAQTPPGRISITEKLQYDDSTLTADQVLVSIQSKYLAGLKRCYKDTLVRDPTARGKVSVKLTVNETGRVAHVEVNGFDTTLSSCVEQRAGSWRFASPKDKDGEAQTADFMITFQLVPD
jgi:hypothetical protein